MANDTKKALILEKWAECEARATANAAAPNMTKFVADSKGTDWETNISSLRNHTGKNAKKPSTPKTRTTPAPTPTTLAGAKAEIERQQRALEKQKGDYIALLKSEVSRLKAELERAELELLEYEEEFEVLDAVTDPTNQN